MKLENGSNIEAAKQVGELIAALAKKIEKVVFDRGGYLYHGRVKLWPNLPRQGLKFRRKSIQGKRQRRDFHGAEKQFEERVVSINHIAKVVKAAAVIVSASSRLSATVKAKSAWEPAKRSKYPTPLKAIEDAKKISSRYRLSIIPFPTK